MSKDKIEIKDGVRLFVSPTDSGFACGVVEDDWMYTDEGYFCSVIARGMMKIAVEKPNEVFEEGLEGFKLDLASKQNEQVINGNDNNIISIVPFINKKKLN